MQQAERSQKTEQQHLRVLNCLEELYFGLVEHDGFGDMRVELRILKRGQKEVIIHCGKQYRFVVDCACTSCRADRQQQKPGADKEVESPEAAHEVSDFR